MARTKAAHLRAATSEDVPAPPMSLSEAIERGTQRDILVAQRRSIVRALDGTNGAALAALHKSLTDLTERIAALDARRDREDGGVDAPKGDEAWDAAAI